MWYYEFPRAAPRPKASPGKARKKFGETWWGKRWVDMLSKFEYDERMSRGRAYARADKVKNFGINKGGVNAIVEGSDNYKVHINFNKYSQDDWKIIIEKLTNIPILLSRLLNNEMLENIEEITGYSFIPDSFKSSCSCPDYVRPCKHVAAVFYTLADEIDYDPMILFKINGMNKEDLLKFINTTENEKIENNIKNIKVKNKVKAKKKVNKK